MVGIADLGNKRHRLVARSRPTEMLRDGIYRATSLLYTSPKSVNVGCPVFKFMKLACQEVIFR
jgi:hypothetical protein